MKVGRYLMMVLFGGIVGGIIGGLIGVSENINLLDRNNFANHHYVSIVSTIGIVINICLMIALFFVFNCQIKCNTLSLKSSAGVFQSNRLRGRVFNL